MPAIRTTAGAPPYYRGPQWRQFRNGEPTSSRLRHDHGSSNHRATHGGAQDFSPPPAAACGIADQFKCCEMGRVGYSLRHPRVPSQVYHAFGREDRGERDAPAIWRIDPDHGVFQRAGCGAAGSSALCVRKLSARLADSGSSASSRPSPVPSIIRTIVAIERAVHVAACSTRADISLPTVVSTIGFGCRMGAPLPTQAADLAGNLRHRQTAVTSVYQFITAVAVRRMYAALGGAEHHLSTGSGRGS
jgi:hypothetical protein